MNKKNHILLISKGAIIGSSMMIPGVSGGTMAIILGIYKDLIHAVSNIRKEFKKSFFLLLEVCIGAGIGFLLFSRVMSWLLDKFELPTMYFFIGAVIGGIPLLVKQSNIDKSNKRVLVSGIISAILGAALVLSLAKSSISFDASLDIRVILMQLVTGLIIAIALVLPGISTSHMLLILGMFQAVMHAAEKPWDNIPFILCLGISVVIGVFLITKPLEFAMNRFPQITYLAIIGFVAGSVINVFPGWPSGISILFCILTLAAGYLCIRFLSKYSEE